jgi:hypothetical protein
MVRLAIDSIGWRNRWRLGRPRLHWLNDLDAFGDSVLVRTTARSTERERLGTIGARDCERSTWRILTKNCA